MYIAMAFISKPLADGLAFKAVTHYCITRSVSGILCGALVCGVERGYSKAVFNGADT